MSEKTNAKTTEELISTAKEEVKAAAEKAEKVVKKTASKAKKAADKTVKTVTRTAKEKKEAVKEAVEKAEGIVILQMSGKEDVELNQLVDKCKADYKAKGHRSPKDVAVYVKPEEGVAYYTVNGKGGEDFKVEL